MRGLFAFVAGALVALGASSCNAIVGNHYKGQRPPADKVDILFVLDNSPSMTDKLSLFATAAPAIVQRFVNPLCVDGARFVGQSSGGTCATGTLEFKPVTSIHVGVVTSSLGGRGSDACPVGTAAPVWMKHGDDDGVFVTRSGPNEVPLPDAKDSGFLAWGPDDPIPDPATLADDVQKLAAGIHANGCDFPAPLEAMYRFLIQPDPYFRITIVDPLTATYDKVETNMLKQRRAFLRPDSAVVIVILSDRNDGSVDPRGFDGFDWAFLDSTIEPTLPSAACASNPTSDECKPCFLKNGDACNGVNGGRYLPKDDPLPLRLFQTKRRFGNDALFPINRYLRGLTLDKVPESPGEEHLLEYAGDDNAICTNPLYAATLYDPDESFASDADRNDARCHRPRGPRSADKVFLAVITGVPPDLLRFDPNDRYAGELGDADWAKILGGSMSYDTRGVDPRMVESIDPRGVDGDRDTQGKDLQYACTFPIAPRSCAGSIAPCDCSGAHPQTPLCDSTNAQTQVRAKAYPGLRQLALAKALGAEGVVASICPGDDGYAPAATMIVDRVAPVLVR